MPLHPCKPRCVLECNSFECLEFVHLNGEAGISCAKIYAKLGDQKKAGFLRPCTRGVGEVKPKSATLFRRSRTFARR